MSPESERMSLPRRSRYEARFLGPYTEIATELHDQIKDLPLVCPHGHVDPALLAQEGNRFPNPVELFLRPDHYLLRMLYSQGVPMEALLDESAAPRSVWQLFCDHAHLFWGTPSGLWLNYQLRETFGIEETLSSDTAELVYDKLEAKLAGPEFQARRLFEKFNIEVLATTDAATDRLEHHQAIAHSTWSGRVIPTFRPDKLVWARGPQWITELHALEAVEDQSLESMPAFLQALRSRRQFFASLGCVATDHGCRRPHTECLSAELADDLYVKALRGRITVKEAVRLQGHLLVEMAAMSCEDGLVMQLHTGSFRDHNTALGEQFGSDRGADIPVGVNFTEELHPLLNRFGSHPKFKFIVFTLDETNYARELAPLAGHYPSMLLGPPWWFHDSLNGMLRYFDQVMETSGVFNTAGFNDDTRAFCSIPARHDLWRRASCRWLSGLVADGILDMEQGQVLAKELAVGRARSAYELQREVSKVSV